MTAWFAVETLRNYGNSRMARGVAGNYRKTGYFEQGKTEKITGGIKIWNQELQKL
jgi:hypothetical protein